MKCRICGTETKREFCNICEDFRAVYTNPSKYGSIVAVMRLLMRIFRELEKKIENLPKKCKNKVDNS